MTGCQVCQRREHGALHGPQILLGPKRVHLMAAKTLGLELAHEIFHGRKEPPWWKFWRPLPWVVDPVAVKARAFQQTAMCPVGDLREWPPDDRDAA